MKCPYCATLENRVVDSRLSKDGAAVRRRRQCDKCRRRWTTYERFEESTPVVVKRDGRREAFNRQKLVSGIQKSCEKRRIPLQDIERAVEEIERNLQELGLKEIESGHIGEKVMNWLKSKDDVAYVRFASVYKKFEAIDDFLKEIKEIKELIKRDRAGRARDTA